MAGPITHGAATRTQLATTILNQVDAGSAAGKVRILNGATLLAEITLNDPAGTVSAEVLTFDLTGSPSDTSADATGTADTGQVLDSDDNIIFTGAAGATGSGNPFELTTTSITSGATVPLTAASYTASL